MTTCIQELFGDPCVRGTTGCRVEHGCNLHPDCEAADVDFRQRYPNGLDTGGYYGSKRFRAYHCHTEDCEDCFGR